MSDTEAKTIFVIAQYSGYEGHSAPVQAFKREADARAAIALLVADHEWKLYAVPIWPEPAMPFFSIEPVPTHSYLGKGEDE